MNSYVIGLICTSITLISVARPIQATETFEAKTHESYRGGELNYRIHIPKNVDEDQEYPLVLFLHGAGERGSDNQLQLKHGATDILNFSVESNKPAIIIAPQCPKGEQWVNTPWGDHSHSMPRKPSEAMRMAMELLKEIRTDLPVDRKRIYVTGLSMGGYGTWDILQRKPSWFAAGMPVCGGGDSAKARRLKKLPIWAFHGDSDTVVHTHRSSDMIAAIKKAGGKPTYTEFKDTRHNAWTPTYSNDKHLHWLFSQSR